jgi:hypothetical protein
MEYKKGDFLTLKTLEVLKEEYFWIYDLNGNLDLYYHLDSNKVFFTIYRDRILDLGQIIKIAHLSFDGFMDTNGWYWHTHMVREKDELSVVLNKIKKEIGMI